MKIKGILRFATEKNIFIFLKKGIDFLKIKWYNAGNEREVNNMRNTIKAKDGYHVYKVRNIATGEEAYRIDDGTTPLFIAQKRSYEDYKDEERQNEMFRRCEIFTTVKGSQYIYWRDEEIDADYITKIEK